MIGSILSERGLAQELIKYYLNAEYCFESAILENTSGTTQTYDLVGQPVKAGSAAGKVVPVLSTDEANAIGLIVTPGKVSIANNGTYDHKILYIARGPAIINQQAMPANDAAGTAFDTLAELVTTIKALSPGILFRNDTTSLSSTQTT